MGIYSFQLARIFTQNIRSVYGDMDLITFGVFINGRDQGHGSALIPTGAGGTILGDQIMETAAINGLPHSTRHMDQAWTIGPLQISDSDQVSIVYTATNTSDSQIPSANQRDVDAWTIKLMNIYYSMLLGEFVSGLGLQAVVEFIGAKAGPAIAAFLADPVGKILGYRPAGPCNGVVFADAKIFTGAALIQLPGNRFHETTREDGVTITLEGSWSELTQHYSDEATHDHTICGDTAQTDVTVKITRLDTWSLRYASDHLSVRAKFQQGGSLKTLYGLRL